LIIFEFSGGDNILGWVGGADGSHLGITRMGSKPDRMIAACCMQMGRKPDTPTCDVYDVAIRRIQLDYDDVQRWFVRQPEEREASRNLNEDEPANKQSLPSPTITRHPFPVAELSVKIRSRPEERRSCLFFYWWMTPRIRDIYCQIRIQKAYRIQFFKLLFWIFLSLKHPFLLYR
jgi:hypothetical protein